VKEKGAVFHVDAVQGVGKVPFDVNAAKVDLASLSAHKMYGPKGVGALYVRRKPRVRITAQIDGGGHERGMRSGHAERAVDRRLRQGGGAGARGDGERGRALAEAARAAARRDPVEGRPHLRQRFDGAPAAGQPEHQLRVRRGRGDADGASRTIAVSSGSACTSASLEPSYVLRAIGVDEELAHTSIRFGLGRFNTEEEVDYVIQTVVGKVNKLRELSPLYEMAQQGIDLKSITWAAH
jgi:cysteine desulfurase